MSPHPLPITPSPSTTTRPSEPGRIVVARQRYGWSGRSVTVHVVLTVIALLLAAGVAWVGVVLLQLLNFA